MKTGFLKPFLSALVGSAMLLVALFVIAGMRTDTNIAQASALQNTALASTDATTPTVTLAVEEEATLCDEEVTFKVTIDVSRTEELTGIITVAGDDVDFTIPASDTMVLVDHKLPFTYITTVNAVADVYSGTDVLTTSNSIPVAMNLCIKFDSTQATTATIGEAMDFDVKVMPEVNVISNTKEQVTFVFGDDKEETMVLSTTNTYTKEGKAATYAETSHTYTKTGTYTVSATYESDVYGGGDTAEMTVTVEGPDIEIKTFTATPNSGMSGEAIELETEITEALSDSIVSFCSTAAVSGATKTTLNTTDMVTNTTATFAYTLPTVEETTVYTLDSKLMYMEELVARADSITITVEPKEVPPVEDEYEVKLTASATEIKTGETVTATATVMNTTKNEVVSGTQVVFTKSGVGQLDSSTTTTTDDAGQAIVTATSTETGTMTIMALAESVTDTVSINVVSGETPPTSVDKDNPAKFGTEGTEDYVEVGCTTATTCSFKALCQPSKTPAETHAKAVGYFGCNFTGLDAEDGEFYIKWNQGIATTGLAATISTTETQLLKLGSLQGTNWVTNYDNTVTTSTGLATVNTVMTSDKVSDTGDYAKLVDSEMIYLPIVFR